MTVEKKKNIVESKRKTQKKRVERVLQKRGSLLIENTKKLLVLKGNKTCLNILEVLRDIVSLLFSSFLFPFSLSLLLLYFFLILIIFL